MLIIVVPSNPHPHPSLLTRSVVGVVVARVVMMVVKVMVIKIMVMVVTVVGVGVEVVGTVVVITMVVSGYFSLQLRPAHPFYMLRREWW